MLTVFLISTALFMFLLGMFAERRRNAGICFLVAGSILVCVSAPWFVIALPKPEELNLAVLALVGCAAGFFSLVAGIGNLKNAPVELIDSPRD